MTVILSSAAQAADPEVLIAPLVLTGVFKVDRETNGIIGWLANNAKVGKMDALWRRSFTTSALKNSPTAPSWVGSHHGKETQLTRFVLFVESSRPPWPIDPSQKCDSHLPLPLDRRFSSLAWLLFYLTTAHRLDNTRS